MGAKALFVDILYCSRLALQSLGLVTQTIMKSRKAKTTFRKTLITQGIPSEIARELAKAYPNPVKEILNFVRG